MTSRNSASRRALLSGAAAGSSLLLAGFGKAPPDNTGSFMPFGISSFSSNRLRATNSETVTLRWEYSRGEMLGAQRLRFLKLTLAGIAQELVDLPLNAREFQFTFNGPITVEIQAHNGASSSNFVPRFSAALTVNSSRNLFFRGSFGSASQTPFAPYLGYPQNASGNIASLTTEIEFTQFVGFFDQDSSGFIDPLRPFMSSEDAFRGLSFSGFEAQQFGFREGAQFPPQLLNQPQLGRTNGMIYAGAIIMNGEPLPYKADDGDGQARVSVNTGQAATTASLGFDPIFVAIPFLEVGASPTLADIQLGNLHQRLVTSVFSNPTFFPSGQTFGTNTVTADRRTGLSTGSIKGARTGIAVTPVNNGNPFDALVDILSLEWSCEYLPDRDILNVITLGR
jgi:hypothetical protein